jgi:ATP-dependent exoDNAse (exonuclease V) beta subunit
VGDQEMEGWLSPLNKAIYPPWDRSRNSTTAPGCPKFGNASVIDRPFFFNDEPSVKPGLHSPQHGTHHVVWWDPRTLNLTPPANLGLRRDEILTPAETESPSLAAYRAWQQKRDQVSTTAQTKQFDIFTATETSESPRDFSVQVTIHSVEKAANRPIGPRFGTLVHTILRDAPLDADGEAIKALAQVHGRLLDATRDEIEQAVYATQGALAHPLIAKARSAARLHRELPIILKLDNQQVLEGIIDLAFLDQGTWQIVDFKTDADLTANQTHYKRQLQWYAKAVSALNNTPVQAHLLSI